jgi:hypothetical protein
MICAYLSIRPRPLPAGNRLTSGGQLPFTSDRESVLPPQSWTKFSLAKDRFEAARPPPVLPSVAPWGPR